MNLHGVRKSGMFFKQKACVTAIAQLVLGAKMATVDKIEERNFVWQLVARVGRRAQRKKAVVFGACVWIRVPLYDCMIYMWKA